MAKDTAKDKRPPPQVPVPATPVTVNDSDWDDPYGPNMPDAPAGDTMPPRAARTPSQNGPAMRNVFAYLLDEDPAPPPFAPPSKKRR